jgi:hypothetical protein
MLSCKNSVIILVRDELHQLESYLQDALGVAVATRPWSGRDRLPHFLRELYGFAQIDLLGMPTLARQAMRYKLTIVGNTFLIRFLSVCPSFTQRSTVAPNEDSNLAQLDFWRVSRHLSGKCIERPSGLAHIAPLGQLPPDSRNNDHCCQQQHPLQPHSGSTRN